MPTSDLQLQRLGLMPLAHLPNRDGFRFIGRTRDGKEVECIVAQNSLTRTYHVPGFANLVGWKRA